MTFIARENHLARLFRFPGNKGRVHFADAALLSAEAAANTRLNNAHHGFRNMQGLRHNAAAVENNLRRAEDIQTTIGVNRAIGHERLHHILLYSLRARGLLNHDVAFAENLINIAVLNRFAGAQVALVISTDRAVRYPGILRMHQKRIIQRLMKIKHSIEHVILNLNHGQSLINSLFRLACNNRYDITDEAYMTV